MVFFVTFSPRYSISILNAPGVKFNFSPPSFLHIHAARILRPCAHTAPASCQLVRLSEAWFLARGWHAQISSRGRKTHCGRVVIAPCTRDQCQKQCQNSAMHADRQRSAHIDASSSPYTTHCASGRSSNAPSTSNSCAEGSAYEVWTSPRTFLHR